jgi:hypothetical protein
MYLFLSRLYVVTATLSGKLVKAAISNEEVPLEFDSWSKLFLPSFLPLDRSKARNTAVLEQLIASLLVSWLAR